MSIKSLETLEAWKKAKEFALHEPGATHGAREDLAAYNLDLHEDRTVDTPDSRLSDHDSQ